MNGDHATLRAHLQRAVGGRAEGPPALVRQGVMSPAQRQKIVDVGHPAVSRPVHVVRLGELERRVAQRARAIQRAQRPPLGSVGQARLAPQQQPHAVQTHDHGRHGAATGPTAHRLDRDPERADAGARVEHRALVPVSVDQRAGVDQHRDVRRARPGSSLAEREQGVRLQEVLSLERIGWAPVGLLTVK